jgi:putative hydrolase of the HAD superfamily
LSPGAGTGRTVVFDFGGVLFRWEPAALLRGCLPARAVDDPTAREIAAVVFEAFTPQSDWARFDLGLVEPAELAQRIAARVGGLEGATRGLQAREVRALIDAIPDHLEALPSSVELLHALAAAGHRTCFLSNMPAPYAAALRERNAFVRATFADGLFSCDVGLMKPDPAVFALAESRFGLAPAATLFIDDHAGNVQAARARGWQALRFVGAEALRQDLEQAGWLGR